MNKILITGGAGFVGINLVRFLLRTGDYKISVVDNLSTGNFSLLKEIVQSEGGQIEDQFSPAPKNLCFYKEDIQDAVALSRIMPGQEYVVHLAAQTGVIPSMADPLRDAAVNINGTLNLLSAAQAHGIQRFLFSSSAAPLGEQTPPLDETKVPAPSSPYGASKLAGEAYCSAFYHSFGLETAALRFSNLYGPNSFHKGSVVSLFIKQMLKGETLTIYGDGQQTRDFLYVEDIASIIHILLQKEPAGFIPGQILQLGTGLETSVNHLIAMLKEVSGMNPEIRFQPERKGEIKRNYTSIEKLKQCTGFQPQMDLKQGLRETWKWFNKKS